MNRVSRAMKVLGLVVFVGLISWSVVIASNRINQGESLPFPTVIRSPSPTRPANCVPIPYEVQISGTLTPTPNRFSTSLPHSSPSVTPRSYAHTYDLSPELPISEKSQIEVFRCNGMFDLYLAGPNVDVYQAIKLEDGDIILGSSPPASLIGHEPPEPQGSEPTYMPPTPILTSSPYPPPATPIESTPAPYPAPITSTPGNPEP